VRWVLLTALLAVLAAGCGSSNEAGPGSSTEAVEEPSASVTVPTDEAPATRDDEYFQAVRRIVDGPARQATAYYGPLVGEETPPAECRDYAHRFEMQLLRIVEEADALVPPAHVADLHERFVDAAWKAVAAVEEPLGRVADGELSCGRTVYDLIVGLPTTARAERLLWKIEEQGYVIFGQ
jgi:hypothetical protein